MLSRLLSKFADWALSKNAPGSYQGEDDKRWAYTIETDGSPYLTRVMLPWRIFGVRPYLHHFHRADNARELHNHPWKWALSVILCGSYDEERLDQVIEYAVADPLVRPTREQIRADVETAMTKNYGVWRNAPQLQKYADICTEHISEGWDIAAAAGANRTRQVLEALTDTRRVRFLNYLTKDDYHGVSKLHGDVWTIFITGPRLQDWGFLVDGNHVPWRTYLKKESP